MKKLANTTLKEYFFPRLNQKPRLDILPTISECSAIPKIIHQTYHCKILPPEIEQNVAQIMALNPMWEYRIYDDNDTTKFILDNYGHVLLDYFQRINPKYGAAKADLFRYLLMYQCGGIYLDIKSSITRPLDDVIMVDDRYLLSYWKNKKGDQFEGWGHHSDISHIAEGEFQQWHIAAVRGHPFLKAIIENVLENIDRYNPSLHGVGKYGVLAVTGPIAYSLAIAPLLNLYRHRFVDSQSDLGFKYSIYNNLNHKMLFRSHYTELNESIIKIHGKKRIFVKIINAVKKTKNTVLMIVTNIRGLL